MDAIVSQSLSSVLSFVVSGVRSTMTVTLRNKKNQYCTLYQARTGTIIYPVPRIRQRRMRYLQLLLFILVWSTRLTHSFVCLPRSFGSVSASTSSLDMANGRTREKLRSWFSRRRDTAAAATEIVVVEAQAQALEPNVVAESVSVMNIPPPPKPVEPMITTGKAKPVQVTLTGGQNPSSMLLTGKWEVLPRRRSPDYSIQDALATMDIDINLTNTDDDDDAMN
jgi:hypothetical protein